MTFLTAHASRRLTAVALLAIALPLAAQKDPANLAGDQIAPQTTVREIAADEGAAALWEDILRLKTRASLMMIVAHPDDEDGGMLTYESRGQGVHTAMLTLTRGEGGQNLMSGDFNDALGLVRTQELLAADRYLGVDQLWGTEIDFGFSKTKEESLAQWGHDRVLYDAVRAVRLYRPLVITANFIGGVTDGHGQHQVSGEIAQEVFNAAGDPKVFPDQIKAGLQPWSPLKVYARVPFYSITDKGLYDYATGRYAPAKFYNYVTRQESSTSPETNVKVPEGEYSPVLGMSYLQFARLGLGQQKTQNGGMGIPAAGTFDMPYHRYGSRIVDKDSEKEHEQSFFDGVDTSVIGIASLAPDAAPSLKSELEGIQALVGEAANAYSVADPEMCAPFLRDGLTSTDSLMQELEASTLNEREKYDVLHELKVKRAQFNEALVHALGLSIRAQVAPAREDTGPFAGFQDGPDTFTSAIPGQSFAVQMQLTNPSRAELKVLTAYIRTPQEPSTEGDAGGVALDAAHAFIKRFEVKLKPDTPLTQPPFEQISAEKAFYYVPKHDLRNASLGLPPLTVWSEVQYGDAVIRLGEVVQTAHRETGFGVVYQALSVVPAISVAVSPSAGVVPLTEKTLMLSARVKSSVKGEASGTVKLELPPGWTASPAQADFKLGKDGDVADIPFTVTPSSIEAKPYTMTAVATYDGKEYLDGYRTVGYAGLPPTNLYRTASYRATGVDVKIAPGLRVAYLPGTGDEVEASLADLGIHATTVSVADIAAGKMAGFDAVVLGVRTYAAHGDLPAANKALLDYANAGGTVIVQYNSGQYDHDFGPYPYRLGSAERVVDETDTVTLLKPDAQALSWPNRITPHDFDGWVEERGHGFMESWDPRYEALTEVHDPGQEPQKGGLLVAKTGKGTYVYVAYALYRQLPEGVPGAYRIFANLLSLGKKE
jgi:LmbE family N-acetylglucosaminyl deacetylase